MRLHLIDGTYELFRAHHSKRPGRTDGDGADVKATVGLVASLLALLHDDHDEAVTHVAVAFDNPIRCFRNDLFAGYKDDDGVPASLRAQFDRAEEAVAALGVTVWSMDDCEADDAIATAAARWADDVTQVRILSPDKDFGQCLRGRRVVQVDRVRSVEIDEDALVARRGVAPASIPDLLALVGDRADGLPGIAGFGERSAAAVLARYRRIEDVPADARAWDVAVRGADRLAATLAAERDKALLYRDLATLRTDVPLGPGLEGLAWSGVPRQAFTRWCATIGAGDLAARPTRWV